MSNDTISTMITLLRNANTRRKTTVQIPSNSITKNIGRILLEEGFVKSIAEHTKNMKDFLDVTLKYSGKKKKPYMTALKRISKPGLKIYSGHRGMPRVLGGIGIVILSTSYGLMTDREARQKKIGGEILCYVW
uniref:Small ribosomal subunit protein uS8c n=1 Tax=Hymenophyllum holochilum TaxID=2137820 RepID=A0A385KPF5_9MONI|nr:ribosomal protein S8 [Hymenophyllum holochilum]AXZ97012.1 ribosomal protein S8 [Hymenophyllum holochilum]